MDIYVPYVDVHIHTRLMYVTYSSIYILYMYIQVRKCSCLFSRCDGKLCLTVLHDQAPQPFTPSAPMGADPAHKSRRPGLAQCATLSPVSARSSLWYWVRHAAYGAQRYFVVDSIIG